MWPAIRFKTPARLPNAIFKWCWCCCCCWSCNIWLIIIFMLQLCSKSINFRQTAHKILINLISEHMEWSLNLRLVIIQSWNAIGNIVNFQRYIWNYAAIRFNFQIFFYRNFVRKIPGMAKKLSNARYKNNSTIKTLFKVSIPSGASARFAGLRMKASFSFDIISCSLPPKQADQEKR